MFKINFRLWIKLVLCFSISSHLLMAQEEVQTKSLVPSLNIVKNICSSIKSVGTCKTNKIALITYDPLAFRRETGELKDNFRISKEVPGESECYIINDYLERRGYCVEALPIMHSRSIRDALEINPHLKGRYTYISNVTHGIPGAWVTRSKCESKAREKCMKSYNFQEISDLDNCVENEMAHPNVSFCPCHKEYSRLLNFDFDFINKCDEGGFEQLVERKSFQSLAAIEYKVCQSQKENIEFYTNEGAPGIYGILTKEAENNFVYSVSCNTAVDPLATIKFKYHFCKDAPDGTKFNLSRKSTQAGLVFDAESARRFDLNDIARKCDNGKCSFTEGKKQYDDLISQPPMPQIVRPTKGNYVCFECNKGAAKSIACEKENFPEATVIDL